VFCKNDKKNINQHQLSEKINPLTIVGLILLFSVILTVGEQSQYLFLLSIAISAIINVSNSYEYEEDFHAKLYLSLPHGDCVRRVDTNSAHLFE